MIREFAKWLNNTPISETFKVLGWLVPLSQCIHIVCVAIVMSSVLLVGLRLMGVSGSNQSLASFRHRFLPWVWTAYGLLLVTGVLQIIAEPGRALPNPFFQVKMVLFLVVIGLTLLFQSRVPAEAGPAGPGRLRSAAGALSVTAMLLILTIVVCGRWIAYASV